MVTAIADNGQRRKIAMVVGLVGIMAALATFTITSLALFTDQDTIGANTFEAGTVVLDLDTPTALVSWTATQMAPGDQDTAPLVVTNNGTLDLRYAMSSVTTEDALAAQLVLTVKSGVTTCDNANWTADGTTLYSGVLGTIAGTNVLGDNTQGADTGDRALVATAGETLCFNVTLPLAAPNSVQGITTTATFTFDSEQTDNNA